MAEDFKDRCCICFAEIKTGTSYTRISNTKTSMLLKELVNAEACSLPTTSKVCQKCNRHLIFFSEARKKKEDFISLFRKVNRFHGESSKRPASPIKEEKRAKMKMEDAGLDVSVRNIKVYSSIIYGE